jgi:hypothetical protein
MAHANVYHGRGDFLDYSCDCPGIAIEQRVINYRRLGRRVRHLGDSVFVKPRADLGTPVSLKYG